MAEAASNFDSKSDSDDVRDEDDPPVLLSYTRKPDPSLLSSPDYDETQESSGLHPDEPKKKGKKKKKKGKKKKKKKGQKEEVANCTDNIDLREIKRAMENLNFNMVHQGPANTNDEALRKHYEFWDTQPVPKLADEIPTESNEPIELDKTNDEIRQDPYSLPDAFHWETLDLKQPQVLMELCTFLNENCLEDDDVEDDDVEDDDNIFRFDFSPEFLKWALQPPGWKQQWHCGVRVSKNRKLVGFISAVPAFIRIYEKELQAVEVNFLCVHKKLRSKRVATVLIREITRRVNLDGIFQAVYTADVILPKPVSSCRYWIRSLNTRKLIDLEILPLCRHMTMQRTLKLYRLPDETKTPGFRAMKEKDIKPALQLLSEFLEKFDLAPSFTEEEFRHWFLPRPNIVDSFVVENDGNVTDFVSFYTFRFTLLIHTHPVHKNLKAAVAFYNVNKGTPLFDLMQDALVVAKNMNYDVFTALDLMDNKEFLEALEFDIEDANLQYHLFNWKCPPMSPNKVGLVLHAPF